MTTITNFIEGNFIRSSQNITQQLQNPIWLLTSNSDQKSSHILKQSLVKKCISDNKPLIHIDLGLSTLHLLNEASTKILVSGNGITYAQIYPEKTYFLVKISIQQRSQKGFLMNLIKMINENIEACELFHHQIPNQTLNPNHFQSFGLLIEGLQSYEVLIGNRSASQIEPFIAFLTEMSSKVKQVVFITISDLISKQTCFALERVSTCLTTIQSYNQNNWICTSTVRRYTGYSNQEEYIIKLNKNTERVKVEKLKHIKKQQQTSEQRQMVNSLGFVVKKTTEAKSKQIQLKKMIFPHLQVQDKECAQGICPTGCQCNNNLIILDEEQDDQDDIDV